MGNLTRDPETRQTQSGSYVTKAGVAVNESIPDGSGGYRDQAHFFDVVFFGKQAESFAKWFKKGSPVLIDGRLSYSTWEDKESGAKRSKVEVVGNRWHFVGGRNEESQGDAVASSSKKDGFPGEGDFKSPTSNFPDDVPF